MTTGLNAGKVLLAGGINNGSGTPTVEIFDPGMGNFTLGGNHMAVGRYQHTATLLPNGDVLIAGGSSSFGSDNNNAEIYHAADGTFSAPITMTSTHTGGTATLLPNGKVLIAGGLTLVPSGPGFVDPLSPRRNCSILKQHIHRHRADAHCSLFPHRGSPAERQGAGSRRYECLQHG